MCTPAWKAKGANIILTKGMEIWLCINVLRKIQNVLLKYSICSYVKSDQAEAPIWKVWSFTL